MTALPVYYLLFSCRRTCETSLGRDQEAVWLSVIMLAKRTSSTTSGDAPVQHKC